MRLAFSMVLTLMVLVVPARSSAAVTSEVANGVLRVTGTDLVDVVQIWCDGGDVMVNGGNPGTGAQACTGLTGIAVDGGDGSDVIYLDEVYPMDFPGLTSVRANGEGGNDTFKGSPGDDALSGGDGSDSFYASAGSDDLSASTGDDRILVETLGDVTLSDSSLVTPDGSSTLSGFEDAYITCVGRGVRIDAREFRGETLMSGGGGDDVLLGAIGRDFMTGYGGTDRLVGNDGWDQLDGGRGADVILGGPGNDRLIGGPGRDRCRGGPGSDGIYDC